MKIKDLKHNHSLTDLLKVLIFSILMLAPMIAVGVKCAYVVVNKNAYLSYNGFKKETNNILTNNIESDKNYTFTANSYSELTTSSNMIGVTDIYSTSLNTTYNSSWENYKDSIKYFNFTNLNNGTRFSWYDVNGVYLDGWNLSLNANIVVNFTATNNATLTNNQLIYEIVNNNVGNSLDNVLYYAIDEMSDNQLFSWTKNTGIYTGVKAMTDNLQITTDVIAVLITYWTLLTVIYVIIDIVLKGFTLLTHMFQKESH